MKIISHLRQKRKSRIPIIINSLLAFTLFFSVTIGNLKAQTDTDLETKKTLYLSCLIDEVSLNSYSINMVFDKIVTNADSSFKHFKYFASETHKLHFSNNENIFHDIYSVQLFKIPRTKIPYYVLKFESASSISYSFSDTLWLRVSGYADNDLKCFFDQLIEKGMTIEKLRSLTRIWQDLDGLFNEIDWDCLFEGYETNNTQRDCFISSIYLTHKAACWGCINEVTDNVYSKFSRIILLGHMDL